MKTQEELIEKYMLLIKEAEKLGLGDVRSPQEKILCPLWQAAKSGKGEVIAYLPDSSSSESSASSSNSTSSSSSVLSESSLSSDTQDLTLAEEPTPPLGNILPDCLTSYGF